MATLIVALDLPERRQALDMAKILRPQVQWLKIGMELFTHYGPPLIKELQGLGFHIFLDLKFYDIPHTVARAVQSAAAIDVDLLTLHCQGGKRMLTEAVTVCKNLRAANQKAPLLFGVTALTSFARGEMPGIASDPADFASTLADLAYEAALDGIVCSALEVAAIKAMHPNLSCLCPGIRLADAASEDQRRIATPATACKNGADWLVVGRPILQAADPTATAARILSEMNA